MKSLIIIAYFSFSIPLSAQNWTNIPRSGIQFSNLVHADSDNWKEVEFEYFKKGDSLIGVEKNLAKSFFDLFKSAPSAFADIFKQAYWKTTELNKYSPYYDSTIQKIKFHTAVIISDRKTINGHNERVWVLTNITWTGSGLHPCFLNVSFLKRNNNGMTDDRYLSSSHDYCEF